MRVALLGDSTFGILLPETGELGASRFAERVRAATDAWLIAAGLSVRLEVAWAQRFRLTFMETANKAHLPTTVYPGVVG